jgi:hypothetical protein
MPWVVFTCAIVVSFFIHEMGHCAVAWLYGYPAIPTPAKEYILKPLPEAVQYQVALGGILGSVAALLAGAFWLHLRPTASRSALLAGAMTAPGFYTLRFILAGRGHDGTEFQEAQAALGLRYSGHAIDWLFVGLFVLATLFWFWRTGARPTPRLAGRLIVGALGALIVAVLLQSINNAVFDPLFQSKPKQNHLLTGGPEFPKCGQTTKESIETYLASGTVKAIGPVYARKLVEKFGEEMVAIVERESARRRCPFAYMPSVKAICLTQTLQRSLSTLL